MSLMEIIQKAKIEDSHQIVLVPFFPAKCKTEKSWKNITTESLSPTVVRRHAMTFLNEEQKKRLEIGEPVRGLWRMSGQKFYFECFPHADGWAMQLDWIPERWRETDFWNIPKWAMESLEKGRGLNIIVSSQGLVQDGMADHFVSQLSANGLWTAWIKAKANWSVQSDQAFVTYTETAPENVDALVFEGFERAAEAIEKAEEGKLVFLKLTHTHLFASLRKLTHTADAYRFSKVFKMAFHTQVVKGNGDWYPISDFLVNTPSVQAAIEGRDFARIEEIMKNPDAADTGMRSFNQNLLQMILKRKIDLRRGFELSPEPQELDQLLKKVGL